MIMVEAMEGHLPRYGTVFVIFWCHPTQCIDTRFESLSMAREYIMVNIAHIS